MRNLHLLIIYIVDNEKININYATKIVCYYLINIYFVYKFKKMLPKSSLYCYISYE